MPKYTDIKGKDFVALLKRHGFVEHSRAGSHCTLKNAHTSRRITVPVHPKPLGKGLLAALIKQAGLDFSIFEND